MKQSILWKITKPNAVIDASFLLGTVHIHTAFAFANLHTYQQLILSCEAYAGESDLDELGEMALPGMMDQAYSERYDYFLSENQYKHLNQYISRHLPALNGTWNYMHPMLVLGQIETSLMGHDEQNSLDLTLWEFAKEADKELLAIEPATMQQEIFANIELENAFKSVKKAISNLPTLRKKYKKIAKHYQEQNIQALYKKTKKELGQLKHMMIYERNIFMANRIEELIDTQSVFIGIGVGHLSGHKGVLRLLKQKGFKLEAVLKSDD